MPSLTTVNSKDVLQSGFDTLQHAYDDLNEKYNALFENSRSVEKRVREEYEGFVEPLVYANTKKTADEYKAKYEEAIEDLNEVNKELDEMRSKESHTVSVDFEARCADLNNINIKLEASNMELRNLLLAQNERLLKLVIGKANG